VNVSIRPNPESISHGEWARFIFVAGRLCIDFTQTAARLDHAHWERFHAPSDLSRQLVLDGLNQAWHSPAISTAALSMIARDSIDLFSGELRSRIRECANPNGGLMFVDASRPGKRRWCLMKRCGNMAKTSHDRKSKKHS